MGQGLVLGRGEAPGGSRPVAVSSLTVKGAGSGRRARCGVLANGSEPRPGRSEVLGPTAAGLERGGRGAPPPPLPPGATRGFGGPSGCGGRGELSRRGRPRWGHRGAQLCRGAKVTRRDGAGPGLGLLPAPGAGWHRMAQGRCTGHRSCLLLCEPARPHNPVCGAGMAPGVLCGAWWALWVLHGPAALLQVLHGSGPPAVGPAWIHGAGCGSCTAPQIWVQVLRALQCCLQALRGLAVANTGPAWLRSIICGSCMAPWHWVLILHGLEVLGAGPARPCNVVGRSCMALWHWVLTLRGPAAPGADPAQPCGSGC